MKDKKVIILVVMILLLMIGLSLVKSNQPKPVDWKPTFINTKTDPYGTYITYQLLNDIFDKKNIRTTRRPVYNNLKKGVDPYIYPEETYDDDNSDYNYNDYDSDENSVDNSAYNKSYSNNDPTYWFHELKNVTDTTSYLFINKEFDVNDLDMEYLLDFAGIGNNVFISAESFGKTFTDTLGIKVKNVYERKDSIYSLTEYSSNSYPFGTLHGTTRLNTDSCRHPVKTLGINKSSHDTVFIDIAYGRGHIYLHTVPTAFVNVNMLKTEKYDYGFRCLSYLPENSKIIWDEYQKQGDVGEGSDFKVMLANPPLRIALYIILGGLLLFMIFRAKRTQRIIPVIEPPVNSSLEFLGTISNLYYKKRDFHTIVEKRHAYFLDFIRKNYYMPTENVDTEFINILSAKSRMDKSKINQLFLLYSDLSSFAYIENDTFLRYNSLLEEFYREAKNK